MLGNVHVTLDGFSRIDFDKKKVRTALRKSGADVRNTARRLVSRRAVSQAGEYPGKATGRLARSIRVRLARMRDNGGLWAWVGPVKLPNMKDFYPSILAHGVTGRARSKNHKTQPKDGRWRIVPRKDYMTAALDNRQHMIRQDVRSALINSLVPR